MVAEEWIQESEQDIQAAITAARNMPPTTGGNTVSMSLGTAIAGFMSGSVIRAMRPANTAKKPTGKMRRPAIIPDHLAFSGVSTDADFWIHAWLINPNINSKPKYAVRRAGPMADQELCPGGS